MSNIQGWWYFTFMNKQHDKCNCYRKFYGTCGSARQQMIDKHGDQWAFQYSNKVDAGVDEWDLTELKD